MKLLNFITTLVSLVMLQNILAQPPKTLTVEPEMVFVEGGTFQMGNNNEDLSERPVHNVTLFSFYISKKEVTVAQYRAYCQETGVPMPNPHNWIWYNNHPIVSVNWDDAIEYCNWLSRKTGKNFRLPTEAEWEYAARGGKKSLGFKYSGSNDLETVAWFEENSNDKTHAVASKKPNELGIYDMSGNVFEWCMDWYEDYYYKKSPTNNPQNNNRGYYNNRVIRGGSWHFPAFGCRITNRSFDTPEGRYTFIGFRVVSTN